MFLRRDTRAGHFAQGHSHGGVLLGGTLLKVVAPYAYCAEYYTH